MDEGVTGSALSWSLCGAVRGAGATGVETRYGLYLPPWQHAAFVGRAETVERLGRPLGALGAGFVVARAERSGG